MCHKSAKLYQKIQTHSEKTGESNRNAKNSFMDIRENESIHFCDGKLKKLMGIPSASGSSV